MADESVAHNLERMDELDFAGWNGADWEGVFTRYHTDDVLVDVHGQLAVVEQLTRIAAEAAGDPTLASRAWELPTSSARTSARPRRSSLPRGRPSAPPA